MADSPQQLIYDIAREVACVDSRRESELVSLRLADMVIDLRTQLEKKPSPMAAFAPYKRDVDGEIIGFNDETESEESRIDSAASHLRVALLQALPTDDQIIIQHMRDALACLEGK